MPQLHPDSDAIDRVGVPAIVEHFQIRRQAVHYWRREGVPKQHRASLRVFGESMGHDMQEMRQMRDRLPQETSGTQPASSAMPA